jgi:fatty acid desaturase
MAAPQPPGPDDMTLLSSAHQALAPAAAPKNETPRPRLLQNVLTDLPSLAFLSLVVANSAAIAFVESLPWLVPLVLLQAVLILGCQEAKHLCVHRSFLASHRAANDAVGMVCAALFGVNFHAYRHFHFQHHRATCTEDDPEGHLYAKSWRSRIVWLLAPLELGWVAFHINCKAWTLVPASKRRSRNAGLLFVAVFIALAAVLAFRHPHTFVFAYVLPMALFAWFDFVLTQAEHYGVPVAPPHQRRDPGSVTQDVQLPHLISWLMLHRPLHRVHHQHPGLRWADAPAQRVRDGGVAVSYLQFVRRWLSEGPRLWLRQGAEADRR